MSHDNWDDDNWEKWDTANHASVKPTPYTKSKKTLILPAPPPPSSAFSDDKLRELHPYFNSKPAVRILTRKDAPPSSTGVESQEFSQSQQSQPQEQTLEEREKEYAKARARIFNDSQSTSKPSKANSNGSSKNNRGM